MHLINERTSDKGPINDNDTAASCFAGKNVVIKL